MTKEITLTIFGDVYTFPVVSKDFVRVAKCERLRKLDDDDYFNTMLDIASDFNEQVKRNGQGGQYWGIKYNWLVKQDYNRWKRTKHAKDKIGELIQNGMAVFGTLTFTDKVLQSTSVETRRRYVARFLNDTCLTYVANIDFGEKNGREHYHFVAVPWSAQQKLDCTYWIKHYGAVKVEPIHTTKDDTTRTLKYLTKLTAHAVKETTGKQYSLLYCR